MSENGVSDEVVGAFDFDIIDMFVADVFDRGDSVPEDMAIKFFLGIGYPNYSLTSSYVYGIF